VLEVGVGVVVVGRLDACGGGAVLESARFVPHAPNTMVEVANAARAARVLFMLG
jgi:hypothetical protein